MTFFSPNKNILSGIFRYPSSEESTDVYWRNLYRKPKRQSFETVPYDATVPLTAPASQLSISGTNQLSKWLPIALDARLAFFALFRARPSVHPCVNNPFSLCLTTFEWTQSSRRTALQTRIHKSCTWKSGSHIICYCPLFQRMTRSSNITLFWWKCS